MNKQNTILLLFTLLISIVCTKSFAHDIEVANAEGITIYYNYINDGTEFAVSNRDDSYDSYSGSLIIPESVTYNGKTYSVTSIGDYAFRFCSGLTSITIPNSVTSIGNSAFSGCSGLTSITIPNSVTSIGAVAFNDCSGLTSITIPNGVTSIGNSTFSNCKSLPSIKIPNGVTSIGNAAFNGCSGLTSITIPNGVTSIGTFAFSGCRGLTSITIPNSVTSIGVCAFMYCSGLTSIAVESDNIKYDSRENCNAIIETSTNKLVCGCERTIIPNSVTSIGEEAFDDCRGMTSITIPSSVTSIGQSAFYHCIGLTSITIPSSVTSIGDNAFYGCSGMTSITIPNGVTSIGARAFNGCSGLTSVIIPRSVTSIGEIAFENCSGLTSIAVERDNTIYDSRENCNAIIETSTNKLVCGCESTMIPNSVTTIGQSAFYGFSGLTSITIPNSVRSIGDKAFLWCGSLTSITIPSSVTSIGNSAFFGCNNLTSVTVKRGTPITIDSNVFTNRANATLYVPKGSKSAYQAANYWKEFKEIVEYGTPQSYSLSITTSTGGYVAYSGTTISGATNSYSVDEGTSHTLTFNPNSGYRLKSVMVNGTDVTSNMEYNQYTINTISQNTTISVTFEENPLNDGDGFTAKTVEGIYMTFMVISSAEKTCQVGEGESSAINKSTSGTVSIPSSINGFTVTSIGDYAFSCCSGLTSVTIPNSVTSIGNYAFEWCSGLTSVTIPNSVTSIGIVAFSNCSGLTSVTIPNGVTSIGSGAFSVCSGLTSIAVESGNTKYDSRNDCNAIIETSTNKLVCGCERTIIPNSVTSIGGGAFSGCSGLTSIIIPSSVTSIEEYAFIGCSGLTSIMIPRSVTSIGYSAFSYCSGLISVTIPTSVTSIDFSVFQYCSGLTSIAVESGNTKYDSRNDCNAIIETSTNTLVCGCERTIIPNSVTSIGYGAFSRCSGLTSIMIPNSVTSIGQYAFYECSGLTSITIPSSVTIIGNYAFNGCSGLTSVRMEKDDPNSITSETFSNRTNATLYVPKGSKSAYQSAAYWKEFKEIVEYSTTTSYSLSITTSTGGSVAYAGNSISGNTMSYKVDEGTSHNLTFTPNSGYRLKSVIVNGTDVTTSVVNNLYTISNICQNTTISVTFEENYLNDGDIFMVKTVEGVDMTFKVISAVEKTCQVGDGESSAINKSTSGTVTIPGSTNDLIVKSIGDSAFDGCCGLNSITTSNSVTSIGDSAFEGCSGLTSITIPNSVTSIGKSAFSGCISMISITIPNSVTTIGDGAFYNCISLTSITIPNSVTRIESSTFSGCSGLTKVFFNATNCTFLGNYIFPVFSKCTSLTTLIIGDNVQIIPAYAFYGCSNLTSITIGNSITSIGGFAFSGCSSLTSVHISDLAAWCKILFSDNPLKYAHHLYLNSHEVTDLVIPDGVMGIRASAFSGCSNLTSVTIPNSVTSIGQNAFQDCNGLTSVHISDIAAWCSISFSDNPLKYAHNLYINNFEFKDLVIPNGVTSIGATAFNGYSNLSSVTIPHSVTSIGYSAFEDCDNLMVVNSEITKPFSCGASCFSANTLRNGTLYIPAGTKDLYTRFDGWREFLMIEEVGGAPEMYRLSFVADNKELSVQDVEKGTTITPPTTDGDGNTISWYTYPSTMPAHDLVVYGMVVKQAEPEVFVWLTLKDGQGTTTLKVKQGTEQVLTITPEEGWKLLMVTMDGQDVTAQVKDGGTLTTPAIMQDATIMVVYEQEVSSEVAAARQSKATVKVVDDGVVISNAEADTRCTVYASNGQQVVSTVIDGGSRKIALPKGQVYVLTLGTRTLKFAL